MSGRNALDPDVEGHIRVSRMQRVKLFASIKHKDDLRLVGKNYVTPPAGQVRASLECYISSLYAVERPREQAIIVVLPVAP